MTAVAGWYGSVLQPTSEHLPERAPREAHDSMHAVSRRFAQSLRDSTHPLTDLRPGPYRPIRFS